MQLEMFSGHCPLQASKRPLEVLEGQFWFSGLRKASRGASRVLLVFVNTKIALLASLERDLSEACRGPRTPPDSDHRISLVASRDGLICFIYGFWYPWVGGKGPGTDPCRSTAVKSRSAILVPFWGPQRLCMASAGLRRYPGCNLRISPVVSGSCIRKPLVTCHATSLSIWQAPRKLCCGSKTTLHND